MREILIGEYNLNVEYYLTARSDDDQTTYGIKLVKRKGDCIHSQSICNIGSDQDEITELINILIAGMVTPNTLLDVVEDYIAK